ETQRERSYGDSIACGLSCRISCPGRPPRLALLRSAKNQRCPLTPQNSAKNRNKGSLKPKWSCVTSGEKLHAWRRSYGRCHPNRLCPKWTMNKCSFRLAWVPHFQHVRISLSGKRVCLNKCDR